MLSRGSMVSEYTEMQDDLYMIEDVKEEYSNSKSFKTRVYSILTF